MRQSKRGKRQEARGKRQMASFFLASCFLLLVFTCFVFAEEKAVYNRETRLVVLTGNPQVEQDCDVVKGDRITIFLDEDKSLIEGGDNRVKAVVYPKDEKTKVKCK